MGRTSRWMTAKQAVEEGLAIVDKAALVTPPAGMEFGYVPIAMYEGFQKPAGCVAPPPSPAPTPSPPRYTPPIPTPAPTKPPHTCEEWCVSDGHCCVGAISSYQHPSCAMGCTIAKYTSSLADCQKKCHEVDNKCDWSIGNVTMNNCDSCPTGCDASDGVYECLFGCTHGDKSL